MFAGGREPVGHQREQVQVFRLGEEHAVTVGRRRAQRSTEDDVGGVSGAVQVELRLEGEQRLVAGLAALHLDQTETRVDARGRTGDRSGVCYTATWMDSRSSQS